MVLVDRVGREAALKFYSRESEQALRAAAEAVAEAEAVPVVGQAAPAARPSCS